MLIVLPHLLGLVINSGSVWESMISWINKDLSTKRPVLLLFSPNFRMLNYKIN